MEIKSKHIVITGGTSGIGRELIRQLCQKNRISVIARPSPALEELRIEVANISVHEADLSDPRALEQAADAIVRTGESVDVLINNAAIQHTPHFLDDDFRQETIRQEVEVNFVAPCTLVYLCLPALLQSERAIILNINSGLGLVPKTSSAVYCGTKGALNIFSQSLRHQLEHTNIHVMQVFLPLVETKMTRGRGTGKLTAHEAATRILDGLGSSRHDLDIGKAKLLRLIARFSPFLAASIMKKA